ncbi:MAG: hypothetical protein WAO98_05125 [Alphaproteobacteria bacterium]
MMLDKDTLGVISVSVSMVGYGSYLWSIYKNRTKPHIFSWGIWGILMALVFFAQMSKGAGAGAWVTGASALMCFIITLSSLKKGEKSITRSDWIAFSGALAAIPIWYLTQDPLSVVILATVIDALAYYPTFRKSFIRPHEEYYLTYVLDISKWIVALFALQDYSATSTLYPLFLLLANSCLVGMILWRRHHLKS